MNTKSTVVSVALVMSMLLCLSIPPMLHASSATAVSYSNSSVNGQVTCTSVVQGPNISAKGKISVVADGSGNLKSGNASYLAATGMSCNYALSSGTYVVQSDGTGNATTNWTLVPQNSSPSCAPTVSQNAISFSLKKASFSAPTARASESGNCSLAASTVNGQ